MKHQRTHRKDWPRIYVRYHDHPEIEFVRGPLANIYSLQELCLSFGQCWHVWIEHEMAGRRMTGSAIKTGA